MTLFWRTRKIVAITVNATFLFSTLPARAGAAEERAVLAPPASGQPPSTASGESSSTREDVPTAARGSIERARATEASRPQTHDTPRNDDERATAAETSVVANAMTPQSLPTGPDTSGVSSQSISVPQGAGKIQGMGESFSMQLSTGAGTYKIPLVLPDARGSMSPSLGLSYSSGGGHGIAGVGWDFGVPSISRQTDRGIPSYDDPAKGGAWKPTQDRFVFNGGQELVPICLVAGSTCDHAIPGETMPSWASGWQYFRPRVEGGFLRFFWSPDHRTWRVQSKSGENLEIGAPLDGSVATGAIETDPSAPSRIFRWNLSRQYDAQGAANPVGSDPVNPVNVIVYRYMVDGANSYLTDVYDTPPAASPVGAALTAYAHHTRLRYEWRSDVTTSYRRGWPVRQALRLVGVDVASKTFSGDIASPRKVVRRYHLAYDASYHASMLTSVQVEGRCGSGDESSDAVAAEDASESIGATSCPMLPPMTFGYQHVKPQGGTGSAIAGFEAFDERIISMSKSPANSLDEAMTDLFDINADGLPDVLVTMPGSFGGKHGVYFNGAGGIANSFGADTIGVSGVLGETATDVTLSNADISAGDIDGDGIIDLVHMPHNKQYAVYTPQRNGTAWTWQGRSITTAAAQSPKVDLRGSATDLQRMDVNGDGLIDVVVTTGTDVETFFSLGKFPGGDGQFGHASWTGPTTASISNDPVASCVPVMGLPVKFSDSNIRIGDMNGDGLPDIVRVRQGDIRYLPGRGNGVWGTGDPSTCTKGTFASGTDIAMTSSPQTFDPEDSDMRIDDVNGDGLDDMVRVNFPNIEIWLNVDGTSWTSEHVIVDTPKVPSFVHRVRLVDMNGSGTRDILWGDGSNYRFIDLTGGVQPGVLNHVANGLGKTTDLEYASSASLMLAAEAAKTPWTSKMPMSVHVVTKVTDSDNLQVVGRPAGKYVTTYQYGNPVYDGRQREFRGFRNVRATKLGDANSPSSSSDSTFSLGECIDEEPPGALPSPCTFAGRWRDNPREALKGLPITEETLDESNVYASTAHHTYRLRVLYPGLDGRDVRHAFKSQSDSWLYDTAAFDHQSSSVSMAEVELDTHLAPLDWRWDAHSIDLPAETQTLVTLRASAGRAHIHTAAQVDAMGNPVASYDDGCIEGCSAGKDGRISHYSFPGLPLHDQSGWLWRPFEEYTSGTGAFTESNGRHHVSNSYDDRGNPTVASAIVYGTLPLDRFHEAPGAAVAPAPADATVDGGIVLAATRYDDLGNTRVVQGANHRYRYLDYDPAYGERVTHESIAVGALDANGVAGRIPLDSNALYDRGFGAVTVISDIHMETSTIRYDGLGRVTSVTKPDPTFGFPSSHASVTTEYLLTTDPIGQPFSILHVTSQDGQSVSDASYHESWQYADGMGRTIVTIDQADVMRGDDAPWIATGLATYDTKAAPERMYLASFFGGDPAHFPLATAPATPYSRQRYDAFDRVVQTFALDGSVTLERNYHALSADVWDAADLAAGPHQGTYASETKDGHGRLAVMTERIRIGGKVEARETHTQYLSTGEPVVITRLRVGSGDAVTRWMRYDTEGRMVLNVEPNTSQGFIPDAILDEGTMPPASLKAWRYAYDDAGDLVGTSDPRGCGSNYVYEASGRVIGEDYSPCLRSQAPYTAANPSTGEGFEVLNRYDAIDSDATAIPDFPIDASLLRGRLVTVSDRGAKTVRRYDGRGRVTGIARRIARPDSATSTPIAYAPRWYTQAVDFDSANRPILETTAVVDTGRNTQETTSTVSTTYTKRGLVHHVDSDHGALVDHVKHDADGLALEIGYGDTARTTTSFNYDSRRRLKSAQTYRGPPPLWSTATSTYAPVSSAQGAPSTLQLLLEDLDFAYDAVDNPTEIRDWRVPGEWPVGAKPVTRKMQYDDLYRVARIDYEHEGGDDPWTSPFDAEDRDPNGDSMRAKPSPRVAFDGRVDWQTFNYDWLGNTTSTDDDAHGFYDRSLGAITNGTANAGPYRLEAATNETSTPGSPARQGKLTAAYDGAGNMTSLAIHRDGPCTGASTCSLRFVYDWDEVGRLARARRWDLADSGTAGDEIPPETPEADLQYGYDATDDRTAKTAVDAEGNRVYALYPFDALELRRAGWDESGADYARTPATQVPYLFAHGVRLGRIASAKEDLPSTTSGAVHVFLELVDHLGSTSLVIDRDTSELVEESTYQGYGEVDEDYRPERWDSFREDYRFTGKEEDIEVGLQYFGKRYLNASIQRWISPDPLALGSPTEADLNLFAYVHGRVFAAVDPFGLSELSDSFARSAESGNYGQAARELNGLDMNEMLTSLDRLSPTQRADLLDTVPHVEGIGKDGIARIGYAARVVTSHILPVQAPGDLRASGQVSDAAHFLATKFMDVAGTVNARGTEDVARILLKLNEAGEANPNHIAYVLASAHHESAMGAAMTERASGAQYENRASLGNTEPGDGPRFKGRGYVQITGRTNYKQYSRITGQDLLHDPEAATRPDVAATIVVDGMEHGRFTGARLSRFDQPAGYDFTEARRIVNGTDRASHIADIAWRYRGMMTP